MEEKKDLRVKVKFVEKQIVLTDEKTGESKTVNEFYKGADGKIYDYGTEILATRKLADWLAYHKFIEPLKKENKQAKNRQTK